MIREKEEFNKYIEMRNGLFSLYTENIRCPIKSKYINMMINKGLNLSTITSFINHLSNIGLIKEEFSSNFINTYLIKSNDTLTEEQKEWIININDSYIEPKSNKEIMSSFNKFISAYFVYTVSKRHNTISRRKALDLSCYIFDISNSVIERFIIKHFNDNNFTYNEYITGKLFPFFLDLAVLVNIKYKMDDLNVNSFNELYDKFTITHNYRQATHDEVKTGYNNFKLSILENMKETLAEYVDNDENKQLTPVYKYVENLSKSKEPLNENDLLDTFKLFKGDF